MRVLLCPPDYISIKGEINVHMHKDNPPDPKLARLQWQRLLHEYLNLGVEVWFMDPHPDLQDMCFAANFAWCRGNKVILANFAHSLRMPEKQLCQLWFNSHREKMLNVSVHELPLHVRFEGQGDVVTVDTPEGPLVLMGYDQGRTDYVAAEYLADIHEMPRERVIPMRLVDPRYYHLDMACNYVAPRNLFVYYPDAFDSEGKRIIESLPVELYPVSREDAERFTCNGIFIVAQDGSVKYIAGDPTSQFIADMAKWDIEVRPLGESEVAKNGGSYRCLSLFLPEESHFPTR